MDAGTRAVERHIIPSSRAADKAVYHRALMRLVLASASPRRRELLEAAGFDFDVDPVDVDETPRPGEAPHQYVQRLADEKAAAGHARHPGDIVLGADTTVVVDAELLAKPDDDADAARMLRRLSGRSHDVLTGVSLRWTGGAARAVERSRVWFTALSEAEIAWYVATGEPRGKAGGYAIQGLASRFITRIDGAYANVVGLPVDAVWRILKEAGLARGPALF
jgi:septum formation protein